MAHPQDQVSPPQSDNFLPIDCGLAGHPIEDLAGFFGSIFLALQRTIAVLPKNSDMRHTEHSRHYEEPDFVAPRAWKAFLSGACPGFF